MVSRSILLIEHDSGVNTYVCADTDEARRRLLEYVHEWWSREIGNVPIPGDPDEAIETYFDRIPGESYVIENEVEVPEDAPNRWLIVDDDGEQVGRLYRDYEDCAADAGQTQGRIVGVVIPERS